MKHTLLLHFTQHAPVKFNLEGLPRKPK